MMNLYVLLAVRNFMQGEDWYKIWLHDLVLDYLMVVHTVCPKIYRKSVLHLLKYRFAVYLSRCSTDLQ